MMNPQVVARVSICCMKLIQIHPDFVQQNWPLVSDFLGKGLKHSGGEITVDQLRMLLSNGEQFLLVAANEEGVACGAASVQFIDHPSARIAFVTAVGGRMVSSPEVLEQLEAWCRARGATRIQGAARPSIARLWRQKFGFEQRYIIVEHTL